MKVSVIIPAYNIEGYICECLNSIFEQTLKDIEIIVVNDSSTDNTRKILQQLKEQHLNIQFYIVDQENKGLAGARNTGLQHATGEYVAFVDGDDWLETSALEIMYDHATLNNADVVICDYRKVYPDRSEIMTGGVFSGDRLLEEKEILQKFLIGDIVISACNKLFRKALLDKHNFVFPRGYLYEDIPTVKLITEAGAVYKINKPLYNYRQREGSIMNSISPKMIKKFDLVMDIIRYSEEKIYYSELKEAIQYFYLNSFVLQLINQLSLYKGKNKRLFYEQLETIVGMEEGKKYFKNFVANSYIGLRDKIGLWLIKTSPLNYSFLYKLYKRI